MAQAFLDCDGVLADFDKAASAVFGMPPQQFEHRFGLAVFWKKLAATPDFFARLDLLPDAMELYLPIRQLAPVILTSLPRGHWAEPQNRRWAEEHFPGVAVITTTAALKYEYCHRGGALIGPGRNDTLPWARMVPDQLRVRDLIGFAILLDHELGCFLRLVGPVLYALGSVHNVSSD
jgi:hypothetical protein